MGPQREATGSFPWCFPRERGANMKLTDTAIAALKLPKGKTKTGKPLTDWIYFDDAVTGLGVRLRQGCQPIWVLQYRIGPRQRRMRLGPVKKLGADAARKHAKKLAAQVVLGEDPAKAKAKERTERAKADVTLGGVIESYLDAKRASWRPKTVREVTYQLRTLWKPLHKLPAGEVARADVAARIRKIEQENGATTALRARGALSTV